MSLILKEIDKETHVEFLKHYQTFSFLQLPCWAEVKSGWKSKSVGWFDERKLVCVGLILIRNIPKTKWSLFYLPEGPVLDPDYAKNVVDWLTPLRDFAKESGAFNLKLGPQVTINTWSAATIKSAISDNVYRQFKDVDPDRVNPFGHEIGTKLRNLGGKQIETDGEGFGDVQPRFVFAIDVEGKTDEELLATFSQEWRRNIKKAEKSGNTLTQMVDEQGNLIGINNVNSQELSFQGKDIDTISAADIRKELFENENVVVGETDHGQGLLVSGPFATKKTETETETQEEDSMERVD